MGFTSIILFVRIIQSSRLNQTVHIYIIICAKIFVTILQIRFRRYHGFAIFFHYNNCHFTHVDLCYVTLFYLYIFIYIFDLNKFIRDLWVVTEFSMEPIHIHNTLYNWTNYCYQLQLIQLWVFILTALITFIEHLPIIMHGCSIIS